ncbi:uncharacterized protein LOC125108215 [Lutra lutra]|uniref:uncharacterized protein LOC125108215 n=1 Tax=Lutra lutra TaxID=9657 RepID=UPI001FD078C5|nr:uncharacterized protein LOC125108215 [Lutra lutra]XP_047599643.1 uncharacterized protein LOC125108215 [Lutra lutra]
MRMEWKEAAPWVAPAPHKMPRPPPVGSASVFQDKGGLKGTDASSLSHGGRTGLGGPWRDPVPSGFPWKRVPGRPPLCCAPGLSPPFCQERAGSCWASWGHFLNSRGLGLLLLLPRETLGQPLNRADSWEVGVQGTRADLMMPLRCLGSRPVAPPAGRVLWARVRTSWCLCCPPKVVVMREPPPLASAQRPRAHVGFWARVTPHSGSLRGEPRSSMSFLSPAILVHVRPQPGGWGELKVRVSFSSLPGSQESVPLHSPRQGPVGLASESIFQEGLSR